MSRGGREGRSEPGVTQLKSEWSHNTAKCPEDEEGTEVKSRPTQVGELRQVWQPIARPWVLTGDCRSQFPETPGQGDNGTGSVWESFGAS